MPLFGEMADCAAIVLCCEERIILLNTVTSGASIERKSVSPLGLRVALAGELDLGLGGRAVRPAGALDRLARLQVLVDLEEVLDLQSVELGNVVDVTQVLPPRVLRRDA